MYSDSFGCEETSNKSDFRMGLVYCSAEVYVPNC